MKLLDFQSYCDDITKPLTAKLQQVEPNFKQDNNLLEYTREKMTYRHRLSIEVEAFYIELYFEVKCIDQRDDDISVKMFIGDPVNGDKSYLIREQEPLDFMIDKYNTFVRNRNRAIARSKSLSPLNECD